MNDIKWALMPIFPHPSILLDLCLIPTPGFLPRWLDLYDADKDTREAALSVLESGGGWEEIRTVIEPYARDADDKYSELYRQVLFRSLGTQDRFIDDKSRAIMSEHLSSLKKFLNEYAFQPGHQTAIFKIFERADRRELFKPWLICHLHIRFCEDSLPFPTNPNHRIDSIVKISKPLIGKHTSQPLPKRFDQKSFDNLMNERIIYSQRFLLYDTWKWIEDEIERKVDPTRMQFIEANLPFMLQHSSDKKVETVAKKAMQEEAAKSSSGITQSADSELGGLIVAQCVYCYQLRVENLPGGNGKVFRYCTDRPSCIEAEKKFWGIWKK